MREILICQMGGLYRDDFNVRGFVFGSGKKSVCIVGPTRGNEYQQQFIASRIVKRLKELEIAGEINDGYEIMVIPSVNPYSMNTKKKFWSIDSTDMNRMFPGKLDGVTTEIIAKNVYDATKDYEYGIQFASLITSGSFLPHVRIFKSSKEYSNEARDFMMPYVVLSEPFPEEKKTMNFSWQGAGVKAFSVYSTSTEEIDRNSAHLVLRSVLLFMKNRGIIKTEILGGYESEVLEEKNNIIPVRTPAAGFFVSKVKVGFEVSKGDLLAEIHDPYTDEILSEIFAPSSGVVFYMHSTPMTYSHTAVLKLIVKNC